MKILHLWDICDNSALITERLLIYGHKSLVVSRTEFSRKRLIQYYLRVIYHLLAFRADVVHVNAWTKGVIFARIFSPKSKILMHFHGSEIRNKRFSRAVQRFADYYGFSTRDIFNQDYDDYITGVFVLLPVLVNKMFYDRGGRIENTALYIHHYRDFFTKACFYAMRNRLNLMTLDRMAIPPIIIPHSQMPILLSSVEYYLDFKGYTSKDTLTLTAREALACGCKVVVDNLDVVESFPQTTIQDYIKVYNELI